MSLFYTSTRNQEEKVSASQAILQGLSKDGGLFVPSEIPQLDVSVEMLMKKSYQEVAYEVMKLFLTDFREEELKMVIDKAYDDKFDDLKIAPIKKVGEDFYLELFHGSTIAFKDMALSILPYLLLYSSMKNGIINEIVILTATSGDTGKAAMAGFSDVKGTKIIVFYPKDGVSAIQEKQMVTQAGENTLVVGIKGNFDQAQTAVKQMFSDPELARQMADKDYQFSSANSINIGRLVPQVVYYVYAYAQMCGTGELEIGEPLNVVVPTGNFGNILAAYYAKRMGLPIGKLICASNENKVLYDFLATGVYDKNREFLLTSSPSMDILISSNLERLIYELVGEDAVANVKLMEQLNEKGKYKLTVEMQKGMKDFYGGFATEAEVVATIKDTFENYHYVMDTHTAVAACVLKKYKEETGDATKALIVSTASPYKFLDKVLPAIDPSFVESGGHGLNQEIESFKNLTGVAIPDAIREIQSAKVRHEIVCEVGEMPNIVKDFLGIPYAK